MSGSGPSPLAGASEPERAVHDRCAMHACELYLAPMRHLERQPLLAGLVRRSWEGLFWDLYQDPDDWGAELGRSGR